MIETTLALHPEEAALLPTLFMLRQQYTDAAKDAHESGLGGGCGGRSDYLTSVAGCFTHLIGAAFTQGDAFTDTIIDLQLDYFGIGGGSFDSTEGCEAIAMAREYLPALDQALRSVSL